MAAKTAEKVVKNGTFWGIVGNESANFQHNPSKFSARIRKSEKHNAMNFS